MGVSCNLPKSPCRHLLLFSSCVLSLSNDTDEIAFITSLLWGNEYHFALFCCYSQLWILIKGCILQLTAKQWTVLWVDVFRESVMSENGSVSWGSDCWWEDSQLWLHEWEVVPLWRNKRAIKMDPASPWPWKVEWLPAWHWLREKNS